MTIKVSQYIYENAVLKTSKIRLLCIISILFLGFSVVNAQNANSQDTNLLKPMVLIGEDVLTLNQYCNNRFDYCVSYPDDLFDTILKPANNDGRTWVSEDGNMHLTVYGTNNLDWSLKDEYSRWIDILKSNNENDLRLKTNVLFDDYFELAGVIDGNYYYHKTYLNKEKEQFITLIFRSMRNPIENKHIKDLRETITDSFIIQ